MQKLVKAPYRRQTARDRALVQLSAREMGQKTAYRQTIEPLPRPLPHAVVTAEERHEFFQIAAIRNDRVGRDIALFLEVGEKILHQVWRVVCHRNAVRGSTRHARANAGEAIPFVSIHVCMSRSARSANISRFRFLSRMRCGRSSSRPKLAFIGWKCFASASRM